MDLRAKREAILWLSCASATIVAIAAALPRLRFSPGRALPERALGDSSIVHVAGEAGSFSMDIDKTILAILALFCVSIIAVAVFRTITRQNLKDLGLFLLKASLVCAGVVAFVFALVMILPSSGSGIPAPPAPQIQGAAPRSAPLGPPPPLLVWLVSALAVLLAFLLAARLLRSPAAESGAASVEIAREAEAARLALLSGGDLDIVIMECYRRMSRIMKRELDIERNPSMTAREFELALAESGFPEESVHRLTLLFEAARYGDRSSSRAEEAEAVSCLKAIEASARLPGRKR